MVIDKILNNNVVMIKNDAGEETIYMGRGLAFKKKIGDEIDPVLVEKEFVLKDSNLSTQFQELFVDLPSEEVEVVRKIVTIAEETLDLELSNNIYLTLMDHIHHAILRAKEGIEIPNPLKYETRKFYPKEFEIATKAVELINQQFSLDFKDDEAGFIAFHIANSVQGNPSMDVTMASTEIVGDILKIIRGYFGIMFDENSLNYQRMVTHIQYFSQRYLRNELNGEEDEFLYQLVQSKYPKAFQAVQRANQYLLSKYDKPIGEAEQTYLTIHIQRLVGENK